MTGFIVFAHGSSVESANEAVRKAACDAAQRGGWKIYETAFLGGGQPALQEAVSRTVERGASRVVVIPYFLTLGLHLERDLPALIEEIKIQRPGIEIQVTAPLDGHPALLDALVDRAQESAGKS